MEVIEYRVREGGHIVVKTEVVYGPVVAYKDVLAGVVDVESVMQASVSEYRQAFPGGDVVHPWWQGNEGDWVLADDGRIVRVLAVGAFAGEMRSGSKKYKTKPRSRGWLRTAVGTFPLPRPGKGRRVFMDTDVLWHPDRYKLGQTVPGTWVDSSARGALRLKRKALESKALRMVRAVVTGMDAWDAYLLYFGRRGSGAFLEARFNKVIESSVFMDIMDKVVHALSEQAGVGPLDVLKSYKKLLDSTMDGMDPKAKDFKARGELARSVLDDLSRINGLRPTPGMPSMPVLGLNMSPRSDQPTVTSGAIGRIERVNGRLSDEAEADYTETTNDNMEQG